MGRSKRFRMVKLIDFFKLIRYKNLLIIVLTQYLIRYTLLIPFLDFLSLNETQFLLLVFSTVLVAAAGYIINDYFDIKVDHLNDRKVIIGNSIKRREAIILHFLLSGIGVGIGFILAWQIGIWKLGLINLFSASILWLYSTHFKRSYLIGNLLISLLSALVLIIVGMYDILPNASLNLANSTTIFKIICLYALFAFFTTLIREIIKDLEDLKGDEKMGYQTFAIVSGLTKSKQIVNILSLTIIIALCCIMYTQFLTDIFAFFYVLLFIFFPFVIFMLKLRKAANSKDFRILSALVKVIMFTGTLSMLVFSLLIRL